MENSVAAVLKDDDSVSGTCFLFRKEEDLGYWFTCHHVISALNKLRLEIPLPGVEQREIIDAEYVPEYSNADTDIAVLKTHIVDSLKPYEPLRMGNIQLRPNENERVTSVGFTPRNLKNFISGQMFEARLTPGQQLRFFIHEEIEAQRLRKLGNPWNLPLGKTQSRVFNLTDCTTEVEGGFSGSPICVSMANQEWLCVGMINQASTIIKTTGTAISFSELFDAAGTGIPFYAYADCIVIVVAAKPDEIDERIRETGIFKANAIANYAALRNKWRLFENEEDFETLFKKIKHIRTWQLATVYLDDLRELEECIKYTPQALLFIIDSCSLVVPALEKIIRDSDDQFFRAAYLFPICDARFSHEQKDQLREEQKRYMPHVFKAGWVRKRRDECTRREEFITRVVTLIEEAVKQSMQLHQDDIGRLLEQADIPSGGSRTLPVINIGSSRRG